MTDKTEILPLTGLRFIAALYVFLFHMHLNWPLTQFKFFDRFFSHGAVGMIVFFMLSGFVLTYQYKGELDNRRKYLVSRMARIYPVYVVAAIATLPWLGVSFEESVKTGVAQTILLVTANALLLQAWFPQFFSYWNGGASWSISVEAFCYLTLPIILPAILRLDTKQQRNLVIVCLSLAVLPSLVLRYFETQTPTVFYSMPIFRLPEFVIGCVTCVAWASGRLAPPKGLTVTVVFLTFCYYLGDASSRLPTYIGHNWIAVPTIGFLIFGLAHNRGLFARILSTDVFLWLGKVSYCFYSFQVLVLLVIRDFHSEIVNFAPLLGDNRMLLGASFLTLLGLSAIGYHAIEEPARRMIKRRFAT